MKIVMFTNTYKPHVGGVANSVDRFTRSFRTAGDDVLVVAPTFEGQPENEEGVCRIPAIQNFNGSDFSVALPATVDLKNVLDDFKPDILHSHHPFLVGDTALRVAAARGLPLVFTHHTMYEQYTHYVPMDSPKLKRFVIRLSTGYANLCNRVIAPSQSIREIITERGVTTPVDVIPTGVDIEKFSTGDGNRFRETWNPDKEKFIIGHVGRLAPEKNLAFLARAVALYLKKNSNAVFVVVGDGPSVDPMKKIFTDTGVSGRVVFTGTLENQALVDAYHAFDVFAFASRSETQGMVIVEAMAAGCPVVAIDAPGAREVVNDRQNGRLLAEEDENAFAEAIKWICNRNAENKSLKQNALKTAEEFSTSNCARKALSVYKKLVQSRHEKVDPENVDWKKILRQLEREWDLWANRASAIAEAVSSEENATETADQ